jgi:hypothetical protein
LVDSCELLVASTNGLLQEVYYFKKAGDKHQDWPGITELTNDIIQLMLRSGEVGC